jgi:hypothetical protein
MSSVLDISDDPTYRGRMLISGVRSVVAGITRFLDLMPEPLVLRAIEAPGAPSRPS